MPCLVAIVALAAPRLTILLLWLLTGWFRAVFDGLLWPVLGFFFAPLTLLWYSAVVNWWDGTWGPWQIAGIVVAVLLDLSPAKAKRR